MINRADVIELELYNMAKGNEYENLNILLFKEVGGERILPVMVNEEELNYLAAENFKNQSSCVIESNKFLSKLTDYFSINISEITINNIHDGFCMCSLTLSQNDNVTTMPCSIFIASNLAIHYKIPIYVNKDLFEAQYISPTNNEMKLPIKTLNLQLLKDALKGAIEKEDYILASQLRDEIKRRNERS